MKPIPPFTALRCFEAVARLGGVTQAARELHVTHSAVSQQIKVLEDSMGVALFMREARGLRPTEEGRLYALEIRSALRDITRATRRAQARPHESELVVATMPSFAQHWLVPRLASFRETHPYYRVRLLTSLQVEDLRQGVSDIGIRMGQGHWPDVAQQKLFDDEVLVVAAPHFTLAPGGRLPVTFDGGLLHPSNEISDRSLQCYSDGPTIYRGVRGEIAWYFGQELVAELDRLEGGGAALAGKAATK